ncbi:WXG100 family type VII secretion target [Nonomuraea sp. NPDC050153]|uniref:WXG100 family type VII secretion target n=1 Tax=Nonomuraea sp. NPDC050153 TaxID=3364359 RepID=UPI003796AA6D
MSYEEGKTLYSAAAASAAIASGIILRPWAAYVTAMIGLMISDPGQMSASAKTWRTTDNGGQAYELFLLQTDLAVIKASLQNKDKAAWDGAAFDQFDQAHQKFLDSLKVLESARNSTGEAVDQSAKLYYQGARICVGIAALMMAYAIKLLICSTNPVAYFKARLDEIKTAKAAVGTGKSLLLKHGIAIGALTYLLFQVIEHTENTGQAFPTVKAIPSELSALKPGASPEFDSAALEYVEESGKLAKPQLDLQSGGIALPGQG